MDQHFKEKPMGNMDTKEINAAKKLLPVFTVVGSAFEFDADVLAIVTPNFTKNWFEYLLMAICSRESRFGLALSANMTGDGGHGRGLMQIDDRSHTEWIRTHNWKDPVVNIEYGADVWMENYNFFADHFDLVGEDYMKMIWAATAAYNCGAGNVQKALKAGADVDSRTTGKDYSADVRAKMKFLVSLGLF